MSSDLIPAGLTLQRYRQRLAWIRRRERFGPSGLSPELSAQFAQRLRRNLPRMIATRRRKPRSVRCKRGHLWSPQTTRMRGAYRVCRVCERLLAGKRPLWVVTTDGVQVSLIVMDKAYWKRWDRLHAALKVSHPDSGGSHHKFIRAYRALKFFLVQQIRVYAVCGAVPPSKNQRPKLRRTLPSEAYARAWTTRRARYGFCGQGVPTKPKGVYTKERAAKMWATRRKRFGFTGQAKHERKTA